MNLSEMQNTQPDKRANFHFTVCTLLKSIKFLPPGLSEISLLPISKFKLLKHYESVSPQKENLYVTVKFTEQII